MAISTWFTRLLQILLFSYYLIGSSWTGNQLVGADDVVDILLNIPVSHNFGPTRGIFNGLSWATVPIFAIKQIQSKSGTIIPELENFTCNVTYEYSFIDSVFDFTPALKQYFHYRSIKGVPDAIVGPLRTSSTGPLSFVSGADEVPIVGFSATGTSLDDKQAHPFFFRTIPSDGATTKALSRYFLQNGYPRVAMIYTNDQYGRDYKDGLFASCSEVGIELDSFAFNFGDQQQIVSALNAIQALKLNIIVGVVFDDDLEFVMVEANMRGLTGEGRLWIYSDAIADEAYISDLALNNPIIGATLHGTMIVKTVSASEGAGYPAFDRLAVEYNAHIDDFLAEMQEALPGGSQNIDSFGDLVVPDLKTIDLSLDGFSGCLFDAVMAIAFAVENNCEDFKTNGKQAIFDGLRDPVFAFEGTSGEMRFNDVQSRSLDTAGVVLLNHIFNEAGTAVSIATVASFSDDSWDVEDSIIFPGDTSVVPVFTDPPEEERNLVDDDIRYVGFTIAAVVIGFIIFLMVQTFIHKGEQIVSVGQPVYLCIIGLGLIVFTSTIYFLGWDDTVLSGSSLKVACNAQIWTISLGITFMTYGFIMKLHKIVRIFELSAQFKTAVPVFTPVLMFMLLMMVNLGLLLLWTIGDPIEYLRQGNEFDEFGFVTNSRGECSAGEYGYYLPLIFFHVVQYLFGGYYSLKARKIPDDFQEGKWVSVAFASQIQLALVAAPVLLAVEDASVELVYIVTALMIAIMALTIAIVLWLPKLARVWTGNSQVGLFNNRGSSATSAGKESSTSTGYAKQKINSAFSVENERNLESQL